MCPSVCAEYDPRVKAMELDEKPSEDYSDIGGADKQIQELIEAVVLPMTHADRFKKLGIRAPKGVLLHGRECRLTQRRRWRRRRGWRSGREAALPVPCGEGGDVFPWMSSPDCLP